MKILRESNDNTTFVVKFNKREQEIVEYQVLKDKIFNKNFDIIDTSVHGEYVITQKDGFSTSICKGYLNYVFANEMIDQVIRAEKIKKVTNK